MKYKTIEELLAALLARYEHQESSASKPYEKSQKQVLQACELAKQRISSGNHSEAEKDALEAIEADAKCKELIARRMSGITDNAGVELLAALYRAQLDIEDHEIGADKLVALIKDSDAEIREKKPGKKAAGKSVFAEQFKVTRHPDGSPMHLDKDGQPVPLTIKDQGLRCLRVALQSVESDPAKALHWINKSYEYAESLKEVNKSAGRKNGNQGRKSSYWAVDVAGWLAENYSRFEDAWASIPDSRNGAMRVPDTDIRIQRDGDTIFALAPTDYDGEIGKLKRSTFEKNYFRGAKKTDGTGI